MHWNLLVLVLCSIGPVLASQETCPYLIYPDYRVNSSNVYFKDHQTWMDAMCAQCYFYLDGQEHSWTPEFLKKFSRNTIYVNYTTYDNPDRTRICYTMTNGTDECFPLDFKYSDLNKPEFNVFYDVLNGQRYVVSIGPKA